MALLYVPTCNAWKIGLEVIKTMPNTDVISLAYSKCCFLDFLIELVVVCVE